MTAKRKYVSEIASYIKKIEIRNLSSCCSWFKRKFHPGMRQVISFREDRHIKNLVSSGKYSLYQIKIQLKEKYNKNYP